MVDFTVNHGISAIKVAVVASTTKVIHDSFAVDVWDRNFSNRVKAFAAENKVFGLNRRRSLYVKQPLIDAIQSVENVPGSVYVAVVPAGEGKTTAANAFLHCSPASKGIAMCPSDPSSVSYHEKLAGGLGIKPSKRGWMQIFLKSLHDVATTNNSPCILIFDEFLAGLSERGGIITNSIQADLDFLFQIKSLISEWEVCVIVLTPNVFAAGLALGKNGLSGIVPLPQLFTGTPTIQEQHGLAVGNVMWTSTLWTEELLIDLVVIHHGKFFSRDTIRSWIQGDPRLLKPKLLLTQARRNAVEQSHPNQYSQSTCEVESVPADLSAPVLTPVIPTKRWLGCIPPLF